MTHRINNPEDPITGPPTEIIWDDLTPPPNKLIDFAQAATATFFIVIGIYLWVQFFRWLI